MVCAFCVPSALLQRRRQCGEPVDKNELGHAEPAEPTSNNAIEQMVLDEEDSPPSLTFQMLASQWVWQRTKSVSIPAEEQNAGRVVDYFYRMEFHSTPRFFSDSNYLFCIFFVNMHLHPKTSN